MNHTKTTGVFVLLAILLLGSPPLLSQRMCCQGDTWLKWDRDTREFFVGAYLKGYMNGRESGCQAAVTGAAAPNSQNGGDCLHSVPGLSRAADFENEITDFYKHYPHDRDLHPDEILAQLLQGLTPEQIHLHPFMRHTTEPSH